MEQIGSLMMGAMMLLGVVVVLGVAGLGLWQWWLRRGAMRGR